MDKKSGSGFVMNNPDHISDGFKTIFWVRILKFFFDAGPVSGSVADSGCLSRIPDTDF
jgi:hypothetical protein